MNKKTISHGIIITAVLLAVFVAAALTPAGTHTDPAAASSAISVAEADNTNSNLIAGVTMIADNEVPLAESPFETGINVSLWAVVVSLAAVMTGIVIYEEVKDNR